MVSLFFTLLVSAVVVDAKLIDGQELRGELRQVTDTAASMVVDGKDREFDIQEIQSLAFATEEAESTTKRIIELTDGSVISAGTVSAFDSKVTIKGGVGDEAKGPVSGVRSVRYFVKDDKLLKQWNEIASDPAAGAESKDDLLVVNRNGNLDYLAGVVSGFDVNEVRFEFGGSVRSIPISKIAGFLLAKNDAPKKARFVLKTQAGDQWQLDRLTSVEGNLSVVSVSGFERNLPMSAVQSMEIRRTGIEYLTTLTPEKMEYAPFLGSESVASGLESLNKPQTDSDFAGAPLKIHRGEELVEYKRGLAIRSKSELTYRVARKYQSFQALAGLDPNAPTVAHVMLRVFADDDEVLTQEIGKSDEPVLIDVPLVDVNRLRIVVDYGENMDIGDRLHLVDARLTK